jgi:NADH-ubiquinone oxidoreductase chain 5
VAYWLGTISAVFTAFYSLRLLALTFLTYPNGPRIHYLSINSFINWGHEAPLIMAIPLVILAIMSIFFGYVTRDLFVGPGSDFFASSLFVHPNHSFLVDTEWATPVFYRLLPLIGSLFGGSLALLIYSVFPWISIIFIKSSLYRTLYRFFNQKYFFDNLYASFIINPALQFGYITSKMLDRGVLEHFGPFGLGYSLTSTSNRINTLDTGVIPFYALLFFVSLCMLMGFIMYFPDPKYFLLFLITLYLI